MSLESERAATTLEALARFGGSVVLLDREVKGIAVGSVLCDHYSGVYAAVSDLIARGHRKISLITGSLEVRSSRERFRGMRAAFADSGVDFDDRFLSLGNFSDDFSKSEVIRLMSQRAAPTAILTGGVLTTAGAIRALNRLGKQPGIDVSLIALDEWPMFDIFTPRLASVARDASEIGTTAARLLLDMLSGSKPTSVTVPTIYTPGESLTKVPGRRRKAAAAKPGA